MKKYLESETIYNGRKTINVTPATDSFVVSVIKQIILFVISTGIIYFLMSADKIVDMILGK